MSLRHGSFVKAKENIGKALAIREIGNIGGNAVNCGDLGTQFFHLAGYGRAEKYLRKHLQSRRTLVLRKEKQYLQKLPNHWL